MCVCSQYDIEITSTRLSWSLTAGRVFIFTNSRQLPWRLGWLTLQYIITASIIANVRTTIYLYLWLGKKMRRNLYFSMAQSFYDRNSWSRQWLKIPTVRVVEMSGWWAHCLAAVIVLLFGDRSGGWDFFRRGWVQGSVHGAGLRWSG